MAGSSASGSSSPTARTGGCAGSSAGSTCARARAWCCGPAGASTPRSCASRSTPVFLDADQVVIRIEHEVGPWRTVSCRGAREVVEMAAGECGAVASRSATASHGRRAAPPTPRPSAAAARVRRRGRRAARPDPRREPRPALPAARALPARRTRPRGRGADDPERLPEAVLEPSVDLAVLDGADAVADALRTANATRARRPRSRSSSRRTPEGRARPAFACSTAGTRPRSCSRRRAASLRAVAGAAHRGGEVSSGGRRSVAFVRELTKMRR